MSSRPATAPEAEQQFYAEIERNHLAALWNVAARLMPREPTPRIQPYLWRWKTLRTLCLRSGELTPVLTPLGLYREEAYGEAGGHQQITGVFEG